MLQEPIDIILKGFYEITFVFGPEFLSSGLSEIVGERAYRRLQPIFINRTALVQEKCHVAVPEAHKKIVPD